MDVLFTVATYYPLKDGVQNVTQYMAEGLANLGHSVTVVTTKKTGLKSSEIYNRVNIIRVDVRTKGALYFGEKRKYIDLILEKCKSIDAIINVSTQTALTDLLLSHMGDISCKKILYMHGMYDFRYHKDVNSFWGAIIYTMWKDVRWGTFYLFNGKKFKQYNHGIQLNELDYANQFFKKYYHIKSDIIENAADESFFSLMNSKDTTEKYVISVANYCKRKNQEFIMKAFYQSEKSTDTTLILIGTDKNTYYEKLLKEKELLEKKYGKRKIQLLYGIDRAKTIQYIHDASLFLLGSTWEAYPLSIIEAMASGIPFISTDTGFIKHLPGGYVVDSTKKMATCIDTLLTNDELRESTGKQGYEYAIEHFQIKDKIRKLEKIMLE